MFLSKEKAIFEQPVTNHTGSTRDT